MKNYSKYLRKKSNVIFLFHGVIDKNPFKIRNYSKKHLLKKEFIKVLNDLNKKGNCISLDQVQNNIENNPGAAMFYAFGTMICVPASKAQPVGLGLGPQAGPKKLMGLLSEAGFSSVNLAAETTSNLVFQANN